MLVHRGGLSDGLGMFAGDFTELCLSHRHQRIPSNPEAPLSHSTRRGERARRDAAAMGQANSRAKAAARRVASPGKARTQVGHGRRGEEHEIAVQVGQCREGGIVREDEVQAQFVTEGCDGLRGGRLRIGCAKYKNKCPSHDFRV